MRPVTASPARRRHPPGVDSGPLALGAGLVLAVLAMVALRVARGQALYTAGEGIYGLTARMLLHGADLYGTVVAAQPPNHFLVGAALLAVDDSLGGLSAGVGTLQVCSGLLAGVMAWRLTGSRAVAALTPPAALLTPWAVHENATFIPEVVALPLVLGAALLAARPATSGPAGALAAAAVFVKLPLVGLLLLLAPAAASPRRYATWAAGALAAQAVLFTAVFGGALWHDMVGVQLETGHRAAGHLAVLAAQGAASSGAIVVLAAVAVRLGGARDPALLRTAIALAAGVVLAALSLAKNGTGLYVMAAVETGCLPLAAAGAAGLLQAARRRVRAAAALAAAAGLLLAQSLSLLVSPERPWLFVRGANLTDLAVRSAVRAARACPAGEAYSGRESYVALIARRRMPGGEPDTYLINQAPSLAAARLRARDDRPRCP